MFLDNKALLLVQRATKIDIHAQCSNILWGQGLPRQAQKMQGVPNVSLLDNFRLTSVRLVGTDKRVKGNKMGSANLFKVMMVQCLKVFGEKV